MKLKLSGDEVLEAAEIMQKCHIIFNYINPKVEDGAQENDREIDVGDGSSVG